MEVVASDSNWVDHVQAWSTVGAALVAGLGLFGVYYSLRKDRQRARVETGPYVRVDVFPADADQDDFEAPECHYETESSLVNLAGALEESATATFAACFRNYQPHALGTAFRVAAFFVLEIQSDQSGEAEYRYSIVTIPYVQHDKAVKLHLFRIPRRSTATVWLARLAFSDFYDGFHEHSEGSNENALHGRLTCRYDGSSFQSIPEGRPAGRWATR